MPHSSRNEEIVGTLELMTQSGEKLACPLRRREDPVQALDKLFRRATLDITDLASMRFLPQDERALTCRAGEALGRVFTFLISRPRILHD